MSTDPHSYTPPPAPPAAERWRESPPPRWMQLAAVVLGVGPLYAMVFFSGLQAIESGDYSITATGLIMNVILMLAFGVFLIALLMLLGERVSDLQLRPATLAQDIGAGLALTASIIAMLIVLRLAILLLERGGIIPPVESIPQSNLELIRSVTSNPLVFALFLGPVIWLQAAVIEELTRVFVLTRLWKVWPVQRGRVISLFAWSLMFGLAHIYEGATGVLATALIGLVLGYHYYLRGRVLPLMIAHGLYDTFATLALLYAVRHPEILHPALL